MESKSSAGGENQDKMGNMEGRKGRGVLSPSLGPLLIDHLAESLLESLSDVGGHLKIPIIDSIGSPYCFGRQPPYPQPPSSPLPGALSSSLVVRTRRLLLTTVLFTPPLGSGEGCLVRP